MAFKSVKCELWARKGWWIIVYLGLDTQENTFVASKFAVVSFLCVLNAVSKEMISNLQVKISNNPPSLARS